MQSNTNLNYQPFESLRVQRPVNRIDYICSLVKGLRVLDLGAYDETEVTRVQHKSWKWLHREIADSAAEVLGVDSTEKIMRSGELITGPNSKIIYGNVETLTDIVKSFQPDIIVAGELIEHVEAPMPWLRHLAAAAPGRRLVITTPNATSLINIALAMLGRENCHVDHLAIFSFKTLSTISRRVPLKNAMIRPYYYDAQVFRGRFHGAVTPLINLIEYSFLRPAQFMFPLAAFGLILEGTLGSEPSKPLQHPAPHSSPHSAPHME